MSAGATGTGAVTLCDVAGAACEILGLPLPGPDDAPLHSDGQALWRNLAGGGGYPWLVLDGEEGDVLRFGKSRVAPDPETGALRAWATARAATEDGFGPAPPDVAEPMIRQYELILGRLRAGAPAPREVASGSPWSGANGW